MIRTKKKRTTLFGYRKYNKKNKSLIGYWDIANIVTLPPFNAFEHFDVIVDIVDKKAPKHYNLKKIFPNKIDRHFNSLWKETKKNI